MVNSEKAGEAFCASPLLAPMDTLLSAIDVAIPLHIDSTYHYLVPPHLALEIAPGKRVLVPFGRRRMTGIVLGPVDSREELKPIFAILDPEPLLTSDELDFLRWAAAYYLHPLGEVLRAALPAGLLNPPRSDDHGETALDQRLKIHREPFFLDAVGAEAHPRLGRQALQIFEAIATAGELSRTEIRLLFGEPGPQLKRLMELGLIIREEREVYRDPFREEAVQRSIPCESRLVKVAFQSCVAAAPRRIAFADARNLD